MFSVNSLLITPRKRDEEQAECQSKAKIRGPSGDTSDFQKMFSVNSLLITPRKRDEEQAECQSKAEISVLLEVPVILKYCSLSIVCSSRHPVKGGWVLVR